MHISRLRDPDFHERTLELPASSRLKAMAAGTYTQLRLANSRSAVPRLGASEAYEERSLVFEALREKDLEKAERAMRNHIRNGLKDVVNILADEGTKTTRGYYKFKRR